MPSLRKVAFVACPEAAKHEDAARRLPGPRYDLEEFQKRLYGDGRIELFTVTDDAEDDLTIELDWDLTDVRAFLFALSRHEYHSSQWCATSARAWLDCDAYVMPYNSDTKRKDLTCQSIYLKFGFFNNIEDKSAIVSIHFEKN